MFTRSQHCTSVLIQCCSSVCIPDRLLELPLKGIAKEIVIKNTNPWTTRIEVIEEKCWECILFACKEKTHRTRETLIYEKDYSYEKQKAPLGDRKNKHEENTANKWYWTQDSIFLPLTDEHRCSKDAKVLWIAGYPHEPFYMDYLRQDK